MTTSVRIVADPDPERFLATDQLVWFAPPSDLPPADELLGLPAGQRFAAELDGQAGDAHHRTPYAGVYGVYPITVTVPSGRADPNGLRRMTAAGLTWVGVHPDRRRRGVLTAMVRDHLDRTAAAGVAVSALHASEATIYARFGYGQALVSHTVTLAREAELRAPHLDAAAADLDTRLSTITDPGIAERLRAVDEAMAASQVATLVFDAELYRRYVLEPASQLRQTEPRRVLFAVQDGRDVASAVFRRHAKWEPSGPAGRLEVLWLAGTAPARLTLLRRLVGYDLIGSVSVNGIGADDPLWHWIGGHRGASELRSSENLWVRLVDLPAALMARGYTEECDVVVEVADEQLPVNAGRWRMVVRDGAADVERVDTAADLSLDVAALGAAWLGSAGNLVAMHRAGLVAEHRPGAVGQLWRALRLDVAADPAPVF